MKALMCALVATTLCSTQTLAQTADPSTRASTDVALADALGSSGFERDDAIELALEVPRNENVVSCYESAQQPQGSLTATQLWEASLVCEGVLDAAQLSQQEREATLVNLGVILVAMEEYSRAEQAFNRVLDSSAYFPIVQSNLAALTVMQNDQLLVEAAYEALLVQPETPLSVELQIAALNNRAIARDYFGDAIGAADDRFEANFLKLDAEAEAQRIEQLEAQPQPVELSPGLSPEGRTSTP